MAVSPTLAELNNIGSSTNTIYSIPIDITFYCEKKGNTNNGNGSSGNNINNWMTSNSQYI